METFIINTMQPMLERVQLTVTVVGIIIVAALLGLHAFNGKKQSTTSPLFISIVVIVCCVTATLVGINLYLRASV